MSQMHLLTHKIPQDFMSHFLVHTSLYKINDAKRDSAENMSNFVL